uniref:Probable splicing factor YJU2B n=1 Tax=Geotrypetes seraphini TaxID=260995 RepID=A0A6P8PX14_GEOSA|nr:coiled-coil domain-containing protein 130 [Geotrypetes seraphini]
MGERKGVNKYYPPDFDPAKHGSINGYQKSHPLRERARKLSQGILIIRFEMPYNIWCDGCKNHIGMGVRYNAEKKKVGNYYTTPIYRFRMKCHLCDNHIEIQTDPASCDYVIVSGAQRKEERWDMKDNEQILTTEHEEKKKLETDAMYRLEHGSEDQQKLQRAIPTLSNIQEAQNAWKDDFTLNSMLRRKFREEKKTLKEEEERDQALLRKASLSIPLVKECEEDRRLATLLKYRSLDSYENKQKLKRSEIASRSWFLSSHTPVMNSKVSEAIKKMDLGRKATLSGTDGTASHMGIVRRKSRAASVPDSDSSNVSRGESMDSGLQNSTIPEGPGISTALVADYMYSSSDSEAA